MQIFKKINSTFKRVTTPTDGASTGRPLLKSQPHLIKIDPEAASSLPRKNKPLIPSTRKLAIAWLIALVGATLFTAPFGVILQIAVIGAIGLAGGYSLISLSAQDEQQKLEYLLRMHEIDEDKELLRALTDLPHGIAYWDRKGNLLWNNHAYRDMMGLSTGTKLRGRSFSSIMALAANPHKFETICDEDNHRIATATCLDGRHIRIEDIAKAKRNFVTIVTDVTAEIRAKIDNSLLEQERQQLVRQCTADKMAAEAASRSKTSFLAHLSHDMRTPLNHIIGFADLVQHEPFGPLGDKRYINYLGDIKRSGEALLASFASILELSELESGRTAQNEAALSVDEILKSQTEKYSARADRVGVEFVDFSNAGAHIYADKNLITRMLDNLLDNAIKFTPKGGKIAVNSWAANDGVLIEITDTGIGIPAERMELLNQPFVLGEAAFAKEQNALGLGIATARAIAELNGGRIHIDSAVGFGTTIVISLPLHVVVDADSETSIGLLEYVA